MGPPQNTSRRNKVSYQNVMTNYNQLQAQQKLYTQHTSKLCPLLQLWLVLKLFQAINLT